MVNRANLENLAKGPRPVLHAAEPNFNTLRALTERASDALADARRKSNTLATRFALAYNAAFWLARVALEAAGYRLACAEGHDYGDIVDVSESQVEITIADAEALLADVLSVLTRRRRN